MVVMYTLCREGKYSEVLEIIFFKIFIVLYSIYSDMYCALLMYY